MFILKIQTENLPSENLEFFLNSFFINFKKRIFLLKILCYNFNYFYTSKFIVFFFNAKFSKFFSSIKFSVIFIIIDLFSNLDFKNKNFFFFLKPFVNFFIFFNNTFVKISLSNSYTYFFHFENYYFYFGKKFFFFFFKSFNFFIVTGLLRKNILFRSFFRKSLNYEFTFFLNNKLLMFLKNFLEYPIVNLLFFNYFFLKFPCFFFLN